MAEEPVLCPVLSDFATNNQARSRVSTCPASHSDWHVDVFCLNYEQGFVQFREPFEVMRSQTGCRVPLIRGLQIRLQFLEVQSSVSC